MPMTKAQNDRDHGRVVRGTDNQTMADAKEKIRDQYELTQYHLQQK